MSALQIVAVLSVAIGIISGLTLSAFSVYTYRQRTTGRALMAAAILTLAYPLSAGLETSGNITFALEIGLLGAWLFLLYRALGLSFENALRMHWLSLIALVSVLAFAIALFRILIVDGTMIEDSSWFASSRLMLCLAALVVIEQLVRNTRADLKSRMRYLNIGLGAFFAFNLGESSATLFSHRSPEVLQAIKPAIAAIPTPFVIIASLRNSDSPLRLNLSREFIFSSGVLVAAGVALLVSALGAYYVGLSDRETGMAALVLLCITTIVLLFVVAGSSRTQAWAQRFISLHLLADEHDYRAHWNRVTDQLTEIDPDFTIEQQSIRALLPLFHSQAGALWRVQEESLVQTSALHAQWCSPMPSDAAQAMLSRAGALDEIVDLENDPNPAFSALREQAGLRFLVPLVSLSGLFGIAGIAAPLTTLRLTEEDREIVRLTARQIAGFLALRDADQRLAEARQFDAMHQLTTFLIHDLKTTSSQLSLLVENADRHKHNPEFVDDMLATAANAVERLNRLLHQVRGNGQTNQMVTLTLGELLPDVVASFAGHQPAPILDSYNPDASIYVDRSKLTDALHHLVQNAIDACVLQAREGQDRVTIRSRTDESWLDILIEDTGTGMDQQYIEQKLFAPFETTKGVNGMGVGVFQAREIMRSMGGDLLVHSELDVGTCFTARLPLMGMGRNSG